MEHIRNAVLKCLYDFTDNEEKLIYELHQIIKKHGTQAYLVIFHVLTHLDLEPEKAEECWNEVISHREIISNCLGRPINLRTAICDYFCSINKTMKNPKVVELHIFESKANISKYDYLTGLYSRGALEGALIREIARSKRHETETSLLFFDIDNFKKINDSFGHMAGDMVLKEVARIVREEIRAEDIAGRYGGEEFVVILPETGKVKSIVVGERIREKIEQMQVDYEHMNIRVTISGGLACFPIDAYNAANLIKCADDALYKAKNHGKNNIMLYSHEKRRYFRINFSEGVTVQKIDFNDAPNLEAVGKNMSANGILFESQMLLNIGTKIQVSVPVPTADAPMQIIGTVVRVEIFDSNRYDIGVSFLEMDTTTKDIISQYLMKQLDIDAKSDHK